MSFMPSPGTCVHLRDGHDGIVTKVTPDGDHDRVRLKKAEEMGFRVGIVEAEVSSS